MQTIYNSKHHLKSEFLAFVMNQRVSKLIEKRNKNEYKKQIIPPMKLIDEYTQKIKHKEKVESEKQKLKRRLLHDVNTEKLKPSTQEYKKDDIYFQFEKVVQKMFNNMNVSYVD